MAEGRKGGEEATAEEGRAGGSENEGDDFSTSRIWDRDGWESHGGGMMLARRCFFSNKASHKGTVVRWGGLSGGNGP